MRIELTTPGVPHTTVIDTDQNVTIPNPYIAPILTHAGVCIAVFARDDGFELNVWRGVADHSEPLPAGALMLSVHPERGVTVLNGDQPVKTHGLVVYPEDDYFTGRCDCGWMVVGTASYDATLNHFNDHLREERRNATQ